MGEMAGASHQPNNHRTACNNDCGHHTDNGYACKQVNESFHALWLSLIGD
jgi:hypothetical protein